ncbi:zinc metalloprotease HtpX [Shewanella sp. C32]|uniref:Zinc metalloprotease HtpX n=1 Tax=Shewanella electrica TaxID=515560 RepID=A0ABT2FJX0_9GAMM|nr:zinc metalloprotease HtpX [Shewanella electrica]MCH1924947.1 zinc metalloprotease HtpX [Shewanella electrica]MCS4556608.1 zinc metalloprotease HtpX [Shewanella electrica]
MVTSRIDVARWQENAQRNRLQSCALLLLMAGFLALLGWLLAGMVGIVLLLAGGVALSLWRDNISPEAVMRGHGAQPLLPQQLPALWQRVALLSQRAGLPVTPQLYLLDTQLINAFAVGRIERPAIAITTGALNQLDWRELTGVLAHEISHIRNNDLRVMQLAQLMSQGTSFLSTLGQLLLLINLPLIMLGMTTLNWWAILLLLLAPTLSALAQLALSRTREYDADLNAVALTNDPSGLASALGKIEWQQQGWLRRMVLPRMQGTVPELLKTHPNTDARIARLRALERQQQWQPLFGSMLRW